MQTKPERPDHLKYLRIIAICLIVLIGVLMVTNLSVFAGVFKRFAQVLSSILYGCLFAFLLNPLVKLVDRPLSAWVLRRGWKESRARRFSRAVGVVFAFVIMGLFVSALVFTVAPQVTDSIVGLINSLPDYYRSLETWVLNILEDNPEFAGQADIILDRGYAFLESFIQNELLGNMQQLVVSLTSSAYSIVRELLNMVIGLIVAIYILLSKHKFLAQAKKIIVAVFKPAAANDVLAYGNHINRIFNGFIIGKIIDSLIIGVLCYIGVLILKMPYAMLVAVIVGATNVIPYFGPFLGAIPCALLILLVSPIKCFYFVIFILVLQQLDGNVIGPRILGENVGVSSFWILVSITVFGGLFGFVGMLLGVPVFAVLYMMVGDLVNRALVRRGRSTNTRDYYAVRTVEELESGKTEQD